MYWLPKVSSIVEGRNSGLCPLSARLIIPGAAGVDVAAAWHLEITTVLQPTPRDVDLYD